MSRMYMFLSPAVSTSCPKQDTVKPNMSVVSNNRANDAGELVDRNTRPTQVELTIVELTQGVRNIRNRQAYCARPR